MAIPGDLAQFLARKYDILGQQAAAGLISANANALQAQGGAAKNFADASQIALNAASARGLQGAQAANQIADATKANAQTGQIPLNDAALRDLQGSATQKNIGETAFTGERTKTLAELNQSPYVTGLATTAAPAGPITSTQQSIFDLPPVGAFGLAGPTPVGGGLLAPRPVVGERPLVGAPLTAFGPAPVVEDFLKPRRQRVAPGGPGIYEFAMGTEEVPSPKATKAYKKGTTKVPGKGDGTKDTVHAKLAPGEAVLNKPAAEHVGRGLIAALNKMGAQKMGMA